MREYCDNCKQEIIVDQTTEQKTHTIRQTTVIYDHLVATCPICQRKIINDEISQINANSILEALDEFSILSPFQD